MPTLATSDLAAGAVLSQPVYSPRGILLASAGTVLTAAHLAIFASWGVLEATVTGEDLADKIVEGANQTVQADAIRELIEDRFSLVIPMSPFMREVRRVIEELLLLPLSGEASEDR